MSSKFKRWPVVPLTLSLCALIAAAEGPGPAPPTTTRGDTFDDYHGIKVSDPYRWLEDQQSPETRAWIDAQNTYTRSFLDPLPDRKEITEALGQLMRVDQTGLPRLRNGRYIFTKRRADQDLFVIYQRDGARGADKVLIDPHSWSPDHSTSVVLENVSHDGKLIVYGVRQGGQDETSLRFFDVDAHKDLSDQLPKARYISVSLTPDNTTLYYSRNSTEGPRVFSHQLGTDPSQDLEIFGKGYGPDKIMVTNVSEDGRYLTLYVLYGSAANQTEVYFQDLTHRGPVVPIVKDIPARFFGETAGDTLYLQTNWKAPNQRILAVDLTRPTQDRWKTIVPEGDAVITDLSLSGGRLILNYLRNATSQLSVFDARGHKLSDVALPALGTVSGVSSDWGSSDAFFAYSSFHVPPTIYHYRVKEGTSSIWAQTKVPIDSSRFVVQQVWYASKDGTKVPIFLLHRKDLKLDGSNPVLLTGYGGFDLNMTPTFSARAVLWVERGGIFALPNLRGGGEFGEKWHEAGMFGNKQNVFDDFIAAAERLISKRYTSPSRLSIMGTSNGGLLVGAALTQRPDLFQAVVCRYPLLDMLRYQNFMVARFWVSEYGSSENADQFGYLEAYSPYQNVK